MCWEFAGPRRTESEIGRLCILGRSDPSAFQTQSAAGSRILVDSIVGRTGMIGLFGIDLLVDRCESLVLLEINPRWTASTELVERALYLSGCEIPGRSLIGALAGSNQCR